MADESAWVKGPWKVEYVCPSCGKHLYSLLQRPCPDCGHYAIANRVRVRRWVTTGRPPWWAFWRDYDGHWEYKD